MKKLACIIVLLLIAVVGNAQYNMKPSLYKKNSNHIDYFKNYEGEHIYYSDCTILCTGIVGTFVAVECSSNSNKGTNAVIGITTTLSTYAINRTIRFIKTKKKRRYKRNFRCAF